MFRKLAIITFMSSSAILAEDAPVDAPPASYATCLACHGADGQGMKLGADMLMAPSLTDSKFAINDPEIFARIILKGIKKEGNDYVGIMAPLEAALDDEKLAEVINYVRGNFGNEASTDITAEQVKTWREKYKDQPEASSRADLEAMLEE